MSGRVWSSVLQHVMVSVVDLLTERHLMDLHRSAWPSSSSSCGHLLCEACAVQAGYVSDLLAGRQP